MECEYERDLNHHYLILAGKETEEEQYDVKMITKNTIKGLLFCQIRYREGVRKYYYEISGKQSLKQIYTVKKIGYEELKELFFSMGRMLEELERYLLDTSKLIIHLSYIYQELGKENCYFLYCPDQEQDIESQLRTFGENLLEIIDHEDEKAVNAAYEFYRMSVEEGVVFRRILQFLEESSENRTMIQSTISEAAVYEKQTCPANKENLSAKKVGEETEVEEEEEEDTAERINIIPEIKRLAGKYGKIGGVLLLAMGVLLAYLWENYVFTSGELILAAGIAAISMVIISMFLIKHLSDYGKRQQEQHRYLNIKQQEPISEIEAEPLCQQSDYGQTTFLGCEEWEPEEVLEGKIHGRKIEIPINQNPFVIGKLEENVSYALDDISISRIHAKFIRREKKLYLSDLNSRNGTFKNGVQIFGEEEAEVHPGDEIRFGRLRFTYH